MRMFEVMSKEVQTVKPTMPASDAWELMRRGDIHHLVVMDGSKILGILSDRDAGSRRGASLRAGHTVADLMTTQVVTRSPTDTIRSAANLMRGRTIGCLPILNRGRLVGIVTVSDLLELLGRGADRGARVSRPRAATQWRVPHRKRRSATASW